MAVGSPHRRSRKLALLGHRVNQSPTEHEWLMAISEPAVLDNQDFAGTLSVRKPFAGMDIANPAHRLWLDKVGRTLLVSSGTSPVKATSKTQAHKWTRPRPLRKCHVRALAFTDIKAYQIRRWHELADGDTAALTTASTTMRATAARVPLPPGQGGGGRRR